jgi:LuxR family maltose regulon positive regulatory protein
LVTNAYNGRVADVLLQTKFFKPSLRPSLIARPQLIAQLNAALGSGTQGFTARLTLVSAPAGFGKTTLVSSWLAQLADLKRHYSDKSAAWLSLDKDDNDPVRFLTYLIAALQTVAPTIGESAIHSLQAPQAPALETILTLLINDLSQNDQFLILILDDYHLITSPSVHQTLTFLLEHLPPALHLLIISRSDPPLPLARLRASRQVIELRADDLRFTFDEVTLFFNQVMKLKLSNEEVEALEQRTEGWVAGLQLAALSMQGRDDLPNFIADFTGSHRLILDYLTDEVLEQRPGGSKDFLLQTSILDRLCGPLCDAVTGQHGSQTVLERLEQANLFLMPLDDSRHWYRYHHLFAEMLQARLRHNQPELLPALHRRASDWYEAHGAIAEAVKYALSGGDVARAASLIERERWALLGRGEINTLHRWLDQLPGEIVRARPGLCLTYAWIFSLLEQAEAIEPRLQDAERALTASAAAVPEQAAEADAMRGEIATLRAETALSRSDIPAALEFCQHGLRLLPQAATLMRGVTTYFLGHAQRRGGQMAAAEQTYAEASALGQQVDNLLLALHALANLSIVQMALGRLDEAAASSQRILEIAAERRRQAWPVTGLAYQGLGRLHYEWNDLDAAAYDSRLGIEFGQRGGLIGLEFNSRSTLAFTLQAQNDQVGADEMLRRIATMTEQHHHPVYAAIAAAQEARLRLRQGRLEEAASWAKECGLRLDDADLPYRLEAGYLTLAAVFIAQGQAEAVLDLLHRLQQAAEADQRTGSLIAILELCALAWQAHGDTGAALAELESALILAEPQGYVRAFVDEGAPMRALLSEYRLRLIRESRPISNGDVGHLLAYTNKLLAALPSPDAPAQPPVSPYLDPLSERELEVLSLIATGASNREIADTLVLAVSTVKKHVSNILSKLNATSRTQAVAEARALGLL